MNQVANTVILPVEEYEALRAQVLSLTKERDEWQRQSSNNWNSAVLNGLLLATSQAREQQLREALVMWDELIKHQYTGTREAMSDMQYASNATVKALAIPTDTTALDERLAQEKATSPGDSFL